MVYRGSGGLYTNGTSTASPSGNFRTARSFGGVVYLLQASASLPIVVTASAPSGGTTTPLPAIPANSAAQDFYLISSGANGAAFDVLYLLAATSNTAGTISKFSLVSGSWVANGSYTTTFGGFGLAAKGITGGATLFATSGLGALSANSVVKLTDNAGYNAAINITTANNVTLYTATTPAVIKGIDLAPIAAAQADLTIAASAPPSVPVGTNFDYTLTVGNSGATAASGVSAQFTLPAGLSFISTTDASGFTGSQSGGVVTFSGGSLAAGASATLTVTVTTATPATYTAPVGAALIDPANSIAEFNEGNNGSGKAVSTVVSGAPDLTVDITGPTQAVKDTPFTYTITAQNIGTSDATGVTVQFTLPPGVNFSSASGAGFTSGAASGVVTFSGGSIAVGGSATLSVTATASPDLATVYTAGPGAAVIDPANTIAESHEDNNSSTTTVSTTVRIFPAPTASDDTYSTDSNTPLSTDAAHGLLANDSSATLGFIVTQAPAHGSIVINADGSFTYIPTAGFSGADTFSYTVSDAVQLYRTNVPPLGTFGGVSITGGGYGSSDLSGPRDDGRVLRRHGSRSERRWPERCGGPTHPQFCTGDCPVQTHQWDCGHPGFADYPQGGGRDSLFGKGQLRQQYR